MGRKGGPQGRRGGGKQMAEPELSDSGDEQVIEDAFAQGKNKISLQGGDVDSDEIDLEAVYDLSDTEGDSEDDEDEDEDVDDEPDLDEEIERGGRAGRRERGGRRTRCRCRRCMRCCRPRRRRSPCRSRAARSKTHVSCWHAHWIVYDVDVLAAPSCPPRVPTPGCSCPARTPMLPQPQHAPSCPFHTRRDSQWPSRPSTWRSG